MTDIFPIEAYNYYDRNGLLTRAISYVMDHKYRKSIKVTPWLNKQLSEASKDIKDEVNKIIKFRRKDDHDGNVIEILKWARRNLRYTSDHKKWGYAEKWEDVNNVFETKRCDCESGALLIYVMCRLAGVPSHKLFMVAGDVQGGGHAWIYYRVQPHWGVFLDWCYYINVASVNTRPKFYITGNTIVGDDDRYLKTWFVFNENKSILSFGSTYNPWNMIVGIKNQL